MAAARARGNNTVSVPPVVGLPAELWLGLWRACHNVTPVGFLQWCWPSAGSFLDEPAILLQVFAVISAEFGEAAAEKMRESNDGR